MEEVIEGVFSLTVTFVGIQPNWTPHDTIL